MKPLGRDARSVIDAAREHEGIGEGDRDRLRARVMARAAAAGAVVATTTLASNVAAQSSASTALGGAKLWLAFALTAGGAASIYAVRDVATEPVAVLAPAVARDLGEIAPVIADKTRAASPTEEAPLANDLAQAPPTATAKPSMAASAPTNDASDTSDALATEAALLSRAQIAFGQGNVEAALDLLYQHETRFPRGKLATERRALLAIALCKKGRIDEGTRAAGGLMDRSTPLGARIADACERK